MTKGALRAKGKLLRQRRYHATRPSPGAAPGIMTPAFDAIPPTMRCVMYDGAEIDDVVAAGISAIPERGGKTLWLDICGLADPNLISDICDRFGIHLLTMSDIVHTHQRPKTEIFDDYIVVILRAPRGGPPFESEQITFVLGDGFLLSFQERPGDCFEPVRERLRKGGKRIRGSGSPYLAYALIDALVDGYFPILERYGDATEALEERVLTASDPRLIVDIHLLKRDLLELRRALWPQREAINAMLRDDVSIVTLEVRTYLRDCADHTFQLIDMVEIFREVAQGLVDLHLSTISYRMNEVMKVLTIIATIFIPLTFIVGLYGMNFDRTSPWNMPELGWRFGYVFSLAIMALTVVGMMFMFWRKGWISGGAPKRDRDAAAHPNRSSTTAEGQQSGMAPPASTPKTTPSDR